MVELNEVQLADIRNFGALGYPPDKIISILEIEDQPAFLSQFTDPTSVIFKKYKSGRDDAEYKIDMRVFEMARSGDMTAIRMMKKVFNK